ncbi:hypothetical protein QBC46DRAFT_161770 [Diplogelasinospora grovesii]|uniref:Uncharacterized protein n=1 Tax=Diplogelasinospora grovesii TaxID=303347 RepID=A0AAN6N3T2_9PEZI|nr:hypothetical protein QBC46DRAFT_161770 [Diplogelasinospora grovesii]
MLGPVLLPVVRLTFTAWLFQHILLPYLFQLLSLFPWDALYKLLRAVFQGFLDNTIQPPPNFIMGCISIILPEPVVDKIQFVWAQILLYVGICLWKWYRSGENV